MIKFFRNIRHSLIMEHKTSNYLKYGIGEIVLVVIGILIALQINNWNEKRSNEQNYIQILKEMRLDLETDIINSDFMLEIGGNVDSISQLILDNKLTEQDYLNPNNKNLFWIGLQFNPFDYRKTAFNKFKNFQNTLPEKFNQIFKDINYYYNDLADIHDKMYTSLRQQIQDRHDYLSNNYDWYYLLRKDSITPEIVDFYTTNPKYKNWVSQHLSANTTGSHGTVRWMHSGAVTLLIKINGFLNDNYSFENQKVFEKFGFPLNNDDLDIQGTYQEEGREPFTLKIIGGYLIFNDVYLTPKVTKDTYKFLDFKDNSFKVDRDSSGKIIGLFNIETDSTKNSYAKKLKND